MKMIAAGFNCKSNTLIHLSQKLRGLQSIRGSDIYSGTDCHEPVKWMMPPLQHKKK